jgi:hypothetical protein
MRKASSVSRPSSESAGPIATRPSTQDLRVNRDEDEVIMEMAYSRPLDTALAVSDVLPSLKNLRLCR